MENRKFTKMNDEIFNDIIDCLTVDLMSLNDSLRKHNVHPYEFALWREKPENLDRYARARKIKAELRIGMIETIVTDRSRDTLTGEFGETPNTAAVQRDKLIADKYIWISSREDNLKWGDKIDVTSGGDKINQTIIVQSNKDKENLELLD